MMRYVGFLVVILVMSGCASGKMMTARHYQDVFMGEKVEELVLHYGAPYETRKLPNGMEEYMYLEHLSIGRKSNLMREYVFVISDGRVIDKKMHDCHSHTLEFTND